ncbi:CaiB/BaiF CoA transferase family protein [Chloroflexota bacterium]
MPGLPLEGIRICDLSTWWSGPLCTAYLGGLGAEVIKVESIQRPDGYRFGLTVFDQWWEANGAWNSINMNKYAITLDLNNPKGVELFKKLVGVSDVIVENYTPRVMEAFGLTYPVLKEITPDIIMLSMPAYGLTGPWRDYAGFAFAFEQASGLAYLTGYADGTPQNLGGAADPIAGMHAALAILAALEYRRRTGEGQHIEMSQAETLTCLLGQAVMDYSMNERVWERMGNRDPAMAPHGVYRCKGMDKWVAISISSDAEWKSFCQIIGNPQLAQDERFAVIIDRFRNQDELDKLVESWTIQHDQYEAMDILQRAGIAAGAVIVPHDANDEPHFKKREFFQELTRDVVGTQPYPKSPIRLSKTPVMMRPSPKLGEHNDYVLGTILGLSKYAIKELKKEQIIGTVPLAFGGVSG